MNKSIMILSLLFFVVSCSAADQGVVFNKFNHPSCQIHSLEEVRNAPIVSDGRILCAEVYVTRYGNHTEIDDKEERFKEVFRFIIEDPEKFSSSKEGMSLVVGRIELDRECYDHFIDELENTFCTPFKVPITIRPLN